MATFFSRITETLSWREGETGLAKLYLLKEGDNRNRLLFTDQRLIVFRHGKLSVYDRHSLSHVSLSHKKLLGPLIGGGVAGGLTLFAIFKGIAASSMAILLLIACAYLFYVGIKGSPALLIHQASGRQTISDIILIPHSGEGVKGFIGYVNRQLIIKEEQELYLSISHNEWQHLLSQNMLQPEKNYFLLSKKPAETDSRIRLRVLQDKLEEEIRYEKNKDGIMEYRLYSPLERHQVRLYQTSGHQPVG